MLIFLVYHKVLDQHDGNFHTLSSKEFKEQLYLVQQSGLPILDPHCLSSGKKFPSRGVFFTFDDGTEDHFQIIKPILEQHDIKGIFYVPTSFLDQPGYLSTKQLIHLSDDGHMIGSHSHTHPQLPGLPISSLVKELRASSRLLANILGSVPFHFAPPGGLYNAQVQEIARDEGYTFFRTMDWGYNRTLDPIRIEVVPLFKGPSRLMLKTGLSGMGEGLLKTVWNVKNGLRNQGQGLVYKGLRRTLAGITAKS